MTALPDSIRERKRKALQERNLARRLKYERDSAVAIADAGLGGYSWRHSPDTTSPYSTPGIGEDFESMEASALKRAALVGGALIATLVLLK